MDSLFKERLLEVAEQQGRSSKSPAISESCYNQIVNHLSKPSEKVDSHFKSRVEGRKFQLLDLPRLGLKQVLIIPNDKANKAIYYQCCAIDRSTGHCDWSTVQCDRLIAV